MDGLAAILVVVLVGILVSAGFGAVVHFVATTQYELIDEPVLHDLANARCPQCRKDIGQEAAVAAENAAARDDAGIRMIVGGYVPTAFNPLWNLKCPHCRADLVFAVTSRSLGLRKTQP